MQNQPTRELISAQNVSVFFLMSCLYSAVSLTLFREECFIRIISSFYYFERDKGTKAEQAEKELAFVGENAKEVPVKYHKKREGTEARLFWTQKKKPKLTVQAPF